MNFTAKSKGADGLDCWFDKQFFVELKNTKQEGLSRGEWVVSCFCMVGTNDSGILYFLHKLNTVEIQCVGFSILGIYVG